MKIKISVIDKLFSQYVRMRDKWTCQRCQREYGPGELGLHCSHFHGRRKQSVRFEPDNAAALCFGCHQHMHESPYDHVVFMRKRLGIRRYQSLVIQAETPKRPDYEAVKLWLRSMIKGMEKKDEGLILGKH